MGGIGRSIKSMFSGPKKPSLPKMPVMGKGTGTAAKAARSSLRNRYGRRKTILTGGQGVMEEADIRKKTLLG
jgi:hypothetical protein